MTMKQLVVLFQNVLADQPLPEIYVYQLLDKGKNARTNIVQGRFNMVNFFAKRNFNMQLDKNTISELGRFVAKITKCINQDSKKNYFFNNELYSLAEVLFFDAEFVKHIPGKDLDVYWPSVMSRKDLLKKHFHCPGKTQETWFEDPMTDKIIVNFNRKVTDNMFFLYVERKISKPVSTSFETYKYTMIIMISWYYSLTLKDAEDLFNISELDMVEKVHRKFKKIFESNIDELKAHLEDLRKEVIKNDIFEKIVQEDDKYSD